MTHTAPMTTMAGSTPKISHRAAGARLHGSGLIGLAHNQASIDSDLPESDIGLGRGGGAGEG